MSVDTGLVESIEQTPEAVEHRLVTALRAVGARMVDNADVKRGLVAAESLKPGMVHGDEESVASAASSVVIVIAAEKRVEAALKAALQIPRQMESALREAVRPTLDMLKRAKAAEGDARVAWQREVNRRAREAEERARREAEAAAKEAEESGEEPGPPAEVARVEAPRVVRAGNVTSLTQVRATPMEIVDIGKCPPAWLQLNAQLARTEFNAAALRKLVKKPELGESVVYCGVRFEGKGSAVRR